MLSDIQTTPQSQKQVNEFTKPGCLMDTSTLSTQCKGKLSFSSFQTPQMSLFSSSVLSTTTRA